MSTALAPTAPAPLEPKAGPLTGPEMVAQFMQYHDVQAALDKVMGDQIIHLSGKPFRKKAYWRGITVGYGLTVECVEERREVFGTLPNGGDNFAWIVMYRATTKSGRSGTGDGACSAAEKSVGHMRATEHNVRSHAHTRAFNRAVSNLVGFGEVSAEEIETDTPPAVEAEIVRSNPPPTVPPAAAADIGPRTGKPASSARPPAGFYVIDQFEHDGKWFHVYLGNPPQHYKTQIVKIGTLLKDAYTRRVPVALDVAANKKPGEAGYVNRVRYVDEATELEAREATRIEDDEPPQ